jgi:tetratricopeptide (TPR) repeat protein
MEHSELNQLIALLDNPSTLKQKIVSLKSSNNLSESTEGFISLYDLYDGDVIKIKAYLRESKSFILKPIKKQNYFSKYLKYAALLILLIGVSGGILLFSTKLKNQPSLANQFKEPGLSNYMSTDTENNWVDIMFDFKTKNYIKANKKIHQELIAHPQNDTLIYFSGVINFKLNKLETAKKEFYKVMRINSVYKDRANYYLGNIAFLHGNKDKAIKAFHSLLNSQDIDIRNSAFEHIKELSR